MDYNYKRNEASQHDEEMDNWSININEEECKSGEGYRKNDVPSWEVTSTITDFETKIGTSEKSVNHSFSIAATEQQNVKSQTPDSYVTQKLKADNSSNNCCCKIYWFCGLRLHFPNYILMIKNANI